jgi:hypothetical protein
MTCLARISGGQPIGDGPMAVPMAVRKRDEVDDMSEQPTSEQSVPPGTDTEEVTPTPAGITQPAPPEGGPNADPESLDPADLTPGLGGVSETRPESTEE